MYWTSKKGILYYILAFVIYFTAPFVALGAWIWRKVTNEKRD